MNIETKSGAKSPYHHGDLRKALLEAAEQELEEKGVEAFSLRGVAKRAGVSHAAPAHHFRDTNALLTALAIVASERLHESMKARQEKAETDPHSQFIASGLGYIDFAVNHRDLFRLLFGSERPDADDKDLIDKAFKALMVLVNEVAGMTRRDPLAVDEGLIDVMAAWSTVHGLANLMIADRAVVIQSMLDKDRDAAIASLIDRVTPPSYRRRKSR